jgi:nicotinamide-nucleotide amidase
VENGAVSEETARAMAEGLRAYLKCDWAISVTGIAGPGGGTEEKPVGLVFIGLAGPSGTEVRKHNFFGDRAMVRERTVIGALNMLREGILRERESGSSS